MARLIEELKKLPGVGGKTAQRFAFHILRSSDEDADQLAEAIRQLKASLHLCTICNNITDVDPCVYCSSASRNQRLVCVVEEPTNIDAIEKTRNYNGVYHVLHGTLSPLHGVGPDQLRIANLVASRRIAATWTSRSLPPIPRSKARPRQRTFRACSSLPGLKITRIATGIPVGSDIEYADEVTMQKAMEGRREL